MDPYRSDERRQPSTGWVGRGRRRPRWWDTAPFFVGFAALSSLGATVEFVPRDILAPLMWWSVAVVLLLSGWKKEHGVSRGWWMLVVTASVIYAASAVAVLVLVEPRGRDVAPLVVPVLAASGVAAEAWFARRRRRA